MAENQSTQHHFSLCNGKRCPLHTIKSFVSSLMLKVAFRTQVVGINEAENSGVKVAHKGTQKQTMLHANQFTYVGCLTLSVSTFII